MLFIKRTKHSRKIKQKIEESNEDFFCVSTHFHRGIVSKNTELKKYIYIQNYHFSTLNI